MAEQWSISGAILITFTPFPMFTTLSTGFVNSSSASLQRVLLLPSQVFAEGEIDNQRTSKDTFYCEMGQWVLSSVHQGWPCGCGKRGCARIFAICADMRIDLHQRILTHGHPQCEHQVLSTVHQVLHTKCWVLHTKNCIPSIQLQLI